MTKIKYGSLLLFLIMTSLFSFSQSLRTLKGTISQTNNLPLSGATVKVKSTGAATSSDKAGNFAVQVNAIDTLQISFVGFQTQEIAVGNQSTIAVLMQATSSELANVVVVGYGSQSKRDVTGAVKSIKAESFNRGVINSPEQLIQGKVAGVNVTSSTGEPGAQLSITVRGPGGVRTGSTPLFVVDGLPLDNSSTGGAGNPLNFINPNDIDAIDVLKDASATAIYGARGANGVILITTKKGKAGTSTLNYSSAFTFSQVANKIDVFSAAQYKAEIGKINGTLVDKGANTDWQNLIMRNAFTQEHNLSLSGGSNKLTYYASFNAQKQQGIIKNNDLDRYTGRFNATQRFWDNKLVIDANVNVSRTYNLRPPVSSVIGDALANNPTYAPYDSAGNPARYLDLNNPLVTFQLEKDVTTINRTIANISPSLRLLPGLVYKLNIGVDNSTSVRDIQSLPSTVPQRDGRLDNFTSSNLNTLIENYLTYDLKVNAHNISALLGFSYQKIELAGKNFSINKFPNAAVEPINNPGLGQELTLANNKPGGYAIQNELQSYFGRINYAYMGKYLLTANFRADGSSKFGKNNKYGYFPSFSAGWRITEEKFMKSTPFSNLKLRAGWGLTGNQEIPSKITQALYTSSVSASTSYPLDNSANYPAGTTFTRLANPDIQWEVSKQVNAGLDFGFLNGDLNGSIDVFQKKSTNILLEVVPADPIQPAGTVWTNVKNMEIVNKGLELDLNYRHTTKRQFTYGAGFNIAFLDNIVKNSPYSVIPSGSASGSGLTSATINGYINNQPIGTFFLKQFTGIDASGNSSYKDVDGDGIISDKDRVAAGSALPKTIYAFYFTASYKGFDASLNFNGVSGNKIYDNTTNAFFYKLRLFKGLNTTSEALNYPTESTSNAAPVSSRFLKDGAYLRLNNASIGYTLNVRKLHIDNYISNLRVSLTGQNLWVKTKYDGFDPEVNNDRQINGVLSYGIDYLSYPKARSIIIGLQVSF
ncbi:MULTISPECIES: SusC/RagA family TonB-linked outer membrane protein [unclassified Paraflavitalea]|uniref:SusC/RagA family TonB-linked outer membrane protein n=1 Tax=unclassified Paraflavitalea TaxID=2798305 RepID=UPI003D328DB3